jgi:succinate dehydrogenase / fumarate reductase cytochrome b subunit
VDKTNTTIYQIVSQAFENPFYVVIYILAMIVAAVHVSHGLWSACQTIGANHIKYMPFTMALSIIFSLAVGFGFGIIPIYLAFAG